MAFWLPALLIGAGFAIWYFKDSLFGTSKSDDEDDLETSDDSKSDE
jgi:hypothetical protein